MAEEIKKRTRTLKPKVEEAPIGADMTDSENADMQISIPPRAQNEPYSVEGELLETEGPRIYTAICNAMADVEAIVKKEKRGVNYAFRSIEDVMNELHPILVKHRLFVAPMVIDAESKLIQRGDKTAFHAQIKAGYRFYTIDGSFVDTVVAAESVDYSDKATQQALSFCFKAALLQTFCVPTKDVQSDGDDKNPILPGNEAPAPPANRSDNLPKLPPRQEIPPPAPDPKMSDDAWTAIDKELEQFNMAADDRYRWVVRTLKANAIEVPPTLEELTTSSGRILFKVARHSKTIGEVVNREDDPGTPLPPETPAAEA